MTLYAILDHYAYDHDPLASLLRIVEADTPLHALDAYSIGEGFSSYSCNPDCMDMVYDLPNGLIGATFTNYALIAYPLTLFPVATERMV